MSNEREQGLSKPYMQEEEALRQGGEGENGSISRRKLLAWMGMTGAAFAASSLVNGGMDKAYADPDEERTKVRDLMLNDYVVVSSIEDLRENDAPDNDVIYFVKDRGKEGHFYCDDQDTSSPDDGLTIIVSGAGIRYKRIFDAKKEEAPIGDNGLYEYDRVKPVPPAGQIANEAETIVPYKGALYCLFKGSYSQNDNSYISVVRPDGEGSIKAVFRMDLGVGADARAMAVYQDDVFVFTGNKIKVFRIVDAALQFKLEYTRKSTGFVQTCCMINGRLYAPNWGQGTIEVFDLVNGAPSNEKYFSIGAVGNASIVSNGSIHYLLTWKADNNITRLDIDGDGNVYGRGTFSIPGIYRPRYGTIHNGVMSVGGYSTLFAKTVMLDISSAAPVKIGEYINMPTHVRVGDYLIGSAADQSTPEYDSMYWKLVKVRLSDGSVEVLSDRGLLYPVLHMETVYGILMGQDGMGAGAHAGDSQLGQEIACYSTNERKKGIQIPIDGEEYRYTDTIRYTNVKNYDSGEVVARFASFSPNTLGWLKARISYTIVNHQNVPGQSAVGEFVCTVFKGSGGSWTTPLSRFDVLQSGDLAVTLDFTASGTDAALTVSGALTNALVQVTIQFDVTSKSMGSFYFV
ncbi:hypothetical protein M6D81_26000 [Paenibacillus sp. J5C_2022]|uniref:hypothetical protein n=1 Tax=Paenibacillus sp. J5C2022 TaxID=2977129 RepID=UPI0021D2B82A|nr:hypothetical protein [Paenibacillus sp. J5C2022]MCU6712158.1 hypothetical protein [Paenibacillus sp. J5C2022]